MRAVGLRCGRAAFVGYSRAADPGQVAADRPLEAARDPGLWSLRLPAVLAGQDADPGQPAGPCSWGRRSTTLYLRALGARDRPRRDHPVPAPSRSAPTCSRSARAPWSARTRGFTGYRAVAGGIQHRAGHHRARTCCVGDEDRAGHRHRDRRRRPARAHARRCTGPAGPGRPALARLARRADRQSTTDVVAPARGAGTAALRVRRRAARQRCCSWSRSAVRDRRSELVTLVPWTAQLLGRRPRRALSDPDVLRRVPRPAPWCCSSAGCCSRSLFVLTVPRLLAAGRATGQSSPALRDALLRCTGAIRRMTNVAFFNDLFGDSSFIVGYLRRSATTCRGVEQTGSNFGTELRPRLAVPDHGRHRDDGLRRPDDG